MMYNWLMCPGWDSFNGGGTLMMISIFDDEAGVAMHGPWCTNEWNKFETFAV